MSPPPPEPEDFEIASKEPAIDRDEAAEMSDGSSMIAEMILQPSAGSSREERDREQARGRADFSSGSGPPSRKSYRSVLCMGRAGQYGRFASVFSLTDLLVSVCAFPCRCGNRVEPSGPIPLTTPVSERGIFMGDGRSLVRPTEGFQWGCSLVSRVRTALRKLSRPELRTVADELRAELIRVGSEVGGHFAGSLGTVELTVALHYRARHAARPGGLGRRPPGLRPQGADRPPRRGLLKIKQADGPSGFLRREESAYDAFGAGHAGTSVSAALGMAEAARGAAGAARAWSR